MLIKPLPHGVLLTCIMDACHSGTNLDLPFVHVLPSEDDEDGASDYDGFVEKEEVHVSSEPQAVEGNKPDPAAKLAALKAQGGRRVKGRRRKMKNAAKSGKSYDNTSDASVVMISGCQDDQTSAGTQLGGAMVMAFNKAIEDSNGNISYKDLVLSMREILKHRGFDQIPSLSTARPFNLDCKVIM